MSRENVETVQATIAIWNSGDMNTLPERYDPEVIGAKWQALVDELSPSG